MQTPSQSSKLAWVRAARYAAMSGSPNGKVFEDFAPHVRYAMLTAALNALPDEFSATASGVTGEAWKLMYQAAFRAGVAACKAITKRELRLKKLNNREVK